MWRAVYDDALRKMEQENAKLKVKHVDSYNKSLEVKLYNDIKYII